jgi:hypothetical protein
MSQLKRLLELQANGAPFVQPEYITDDQRKELQVCMLYAIAGATSKERRTAREMHIKLLEGMNPELIYDNMLMFNGRMNYRTVGDVLSLCKSGM